jgi:hypothetical protein
LLIVLLQDTCLPFYCSPYDILQALSAQSVAFAKQLKRQTAVFDGGEPEGDSSDEEDDEGEGDAERGGDHEDDAVSVDSTGEIAWGRLIEGIKTQQATTANLAASGVIDESGNAKKSSSCEFLPLNLMIFLLPALLLIPFYVTVYTTSTLAVQEVQTAEVCSCKRRDLYRLSFSLTARFFYCILARSF